MFASFLADAAVVYRWTDANGVVHFSDQPAPGAETIVTSGSTSNGISPGSAGTPVMPPPRIGPSAAIAAPAIESPAKEQVFFNDDVVPVRLRVEAGLLPTQTVKWNLNGQPLDQNARALSFSLQTLPRGTYAIGATVSDSATGASQTADSVTFYVRQPSEMAPQHKKS